MKVYTYEILKKISKTKRARAFIEKVEEYYQTIYQDKPIQALSFRDYKRFWIDGNRYSYETAYFERRKRLFLLQVLAIHKNKYLEPLEEVLATICDEYTWVVPAHSFSDIDLFSAETGSYLAETLYIFKDKLSQKLKERILSSLERKIISVFESQPVFHWESYKNNWLSVCGCGIGLSYLYAFPERFESVKERLFSLFKTFIEFGLDKEGYCSEGVNYWLYGVGSFCNFFDAYERMTGNRPDFIDCQTFKNTLQYLENARMQGDVYLPFADGGYAKIIVNALSVISIKSLYQKEFSFPKAEEILTGNKAVGLSYLYNLHACKPQKKTNKDSSFYYQNSQVFIRKRNEYALAVKCGNNGEYHNHNDIGAFQIVRNNKRYICDVGAGLYTKEYFGGGRYEIFNCNSYSHSIPRVDQKTQSYGKEYAGKVVAVDKNSIAMDIANAYENGPNELFVTYKTEEKKVSVSYTCVGAKEEIVFRFVSDLRPKIQNGKVWIEDMKISCNKEIAPTLSLQKYYPHVPDRANNEMKKATAFIIEYPFKLNDENTVTFDFDFNDL